MSVWLEITPAALTLSASTPLAHIIVLVRQGMLETDETAQVRFFLRIFLLSFQVTAKHYCHRRAKSSEVWRNA